MNSTLSDRFPVTVDAIFAGPVGTVAADNDIPSAIAKRALPDRCWLGVDGLIGDTQADRKRHGGPDRALNHMPAEHYERWATAYPDHAACFVPGLVGENISTRGLTEDEVCIGDVFTLGEARVQIVQPRQPCWKPGARVGVADLHHRMVDSARTGWFYQVLDAGEIGPGDALCRVEPASHGITIARTWRLATQRGIDADARSALAALAALPVLAPEWRRRLAARIERD